MLVYWAPTNTQDSSSVVNEDDTVEGSHHTTYFDADTDSQHFVRLESHPFTDFDAVTNSQHFVRSESHPSSYFDAVTDSQQLGTRS